MKSGTATRYVLTPRNSEYYIIESSSWSKICPSKDWWSWRQDLWT